MAITQEQADKFSSSLMSFHDSLAEDEKQVLEQLLEQASSHEVQRQASQGRPFFEKFLMLNPQGRSGTSPGDFVTLKFPSDSDEGAGPDY